MELDNKELAEKLSEIYSVFSNSKRLLIFWTLDSREVSVNEIADIIGTSVQNTSQHLRLMKAKNILTSRREGQTIYYRIADNDVGKYCRLLHQEYLKEYLDLSAQP